MAILPLGIARVSNLLTTQVTSQAIDANQAQLLTVENELSTGLRVNTPSDDPAAASMIMQLNQTLQRRGVYATNINTASSQLGETDSTLGDLTGLLRQAQQIASSNVGSDVTAQQRQSAAAIVQSIYNQALSIANKSFNGSYLFGGDTAGQAPFVQGQSGLLYQGSGQTLNNLYDDGTSLSFQVSAPSVFGALTSQVAGSNLAPVLGAQTRTIDVAGTSGRGLHLGPISISNGTITKTVDLSADASISDIVNTINQAAVGGITASISGQHLSITGGPAENITISDTGGITASDLGINTPAAGAGVGIPVTGLPLNPRITPYTPTSSLRGGLGIDGTGLVITNGLVSKSVSWLPTATVQDVLNAINGAGAGVQASISPSGTGLVISNATQGTTLSVGENGGLTAAQLGVRTMSPASSLSQLNNGKGVGTAGGAAPDFSITAKNGTVYQVSISAAQTVQDVINSINTATGGAVTASFATTGNGIVLTDGTAGAATVSVASLNFSTAAKDLGLTTPAVGNVITGTDAGTLTAAGIFGNLSMLITGLQSSNQATITAAGTGISSDLNRVTEVQGQTGAVEQELSNRQTQMLQENTATKSLVSQLQDTNFTDVITQFQTLQTALQATYATAAKQLNLSLLNFLR